jgi:hypothetical protein
MTTTICNEDGSHSGLYFGSDTDEWEIIYRLGDGRPMFYRDDEAYYRYSDGMHIFYVVEDEDRKAPLPLRQGADAALSLD